MLRHSCYSFAVNHPQDISTAWLSLTLSPSVPISHHA